jgi:nucleoside-diphosphate-sugar epimerase
VNILVVGQGAVGRALTLGLQGRGFEVQNISARSRRHTLLNRVEAVVYAGGPAGEAASRSDPHLAFLLHYERVMELVAWAVARPQRPIHPTYPARRLVLIGTVLPNTGLYGALKQVALDHAREDAGVVAAAGDAIIALRCGQIIGPEMPVEGTGVVATWIRQVVRGEEPRVDANKPPLAVTLASTLLDRIEFWLREPKLSRWTEEAVVAGFWDLDHLAAACLAAAGRGLWFGSPFGTYAALRAMAINARDAQVPA